jgi:pimeloyl-ACP methyl ester carboxylesterase
MRGASTVMVPKSVWIFPGPSIAETPEPPATPTNSVRGDKFLDLGLKDQTCKFAEQRLRLRQRQAQLLRTKPCDTTFEPANLDCLHIAPAASGLELEHPFHDRLPPTEETIFTVPRPDDQNFSTPRDMLHGFPQNKAMWARVAPALAQRYTVVCADLRGYGDSSKPRCLPDRSNYSFRAMAGDQLNLMRAFGFDRFHVVGHDRGGRTGHRLALDHLDAVLSLTVMDIVPAYAMFMDTNRKVAGSYWHWYFLSQPEPFPERMISHDPDFFYETCLVGWGATKIADFDQEMLADYRRS